MVKSQKLKDILRKVVSQKILKINAGENTGSIINLEFGEELKLVNFGKFEYLEGDYSLMINCTWRLGNGKSIITSWQESNNLDGPMLKGLELIKNKRVIDIGLSRYYDLIIKLENEMELSVFCDLSLNQSIDTNWFFRDGMDNYVVNNQLQLYHSKK